MRNYKKFSQCKETGKAIYSSEAKAIRDINRYDDLLRVYYCKHCDGFHTTSKTIDETLEIGELSVEEENELLREKINNLEDIIDELRGIIDKNDY